MKKLLTLLISIIMIIAICAPTFAAQINLPAGVSSLPVMTADYQTADRADVTGLDKIPSNAHYDKFASNIYFVWDPKQKNDGILYVLSMGNSVSFNIYVKCSNGYQCKTITGVGQYPIEQFDPKNPADPGKLHNINMIWIGGFVFDYYAAVFSGNSVAAEPTYGPETWNQFATKGNYSFYTNGAEFSGTRPTATWTWGAPTAEPNVGDVCTFTRNLQIQGTSIVAADTTAFNIMADNGFVVLVNGKFAGASDNIAARFALPAVGGDWTQANYDAIFLNRAALSFPEDWGPDATVAWKTQYSIPSSTIIPLLNANSANTITVIAYNGAVTNHAASSLIPESSTSQANPAGVLFSFSVHSQTH